MNVSVDLLNLDDSSDPRAGIVKQLRDLLTPTVTNFLADHAASAEGSTTAKPRKLGVIDLLPLPIDEDSEEMVDQVAETLSDLVDSIEFGNGQEMAYARIAQLFQKAHETFVKLSEDWAPSHVDIAKAPTGGVKRSSAELSSMRDNCAVQFKALLQIGNVDPTPNNLEAISSLGIPVKLSNAGRGDEPYVTIDIPKVYVKQSKPESGKSKDWQLTLVVDGTAVASKNLAHNFNRECMDAFNLTSIAFLDEWREAGGKYDGIAIDFHDQKVSVHPV